MSKSTSGSDSARATSAKDDSSQQEQNTDRRRRRGNNENPSADLVRVYLNGIGKTALLTAEDEVELSQRIEAGLYAEQLLKSGEPLRTIPARPPPSCSGRIFFATWLRNSI